MANVTVNDERLINIGNYLENEGKKLDEWYERYINIMKDIRENAIIDGKVAESLQIYIENANKLCGETKKWMDDVKENLTNFKDCVDNADQYLY